MTLPSGHAASTQRIIGLPDIDWAATPLGDPAGWSPELRTAAGIVLTSLFPSALVWGEGLTTIHNAAFRTILGDKPPAQGRSFADIWSEVWDDLGPIAECAFAGEATFVENHPIVIERHGYPECAWFTFCYSPVRGADGRVAGMIDTVIETTGRVHADARNATLVALGDALRDARTPRAAMGIAADLVGRTVDAMRAGYSVVDDHAGTYTVADDWSRDEAAVIQGSYSIGPFAATAAHARTGRALVVNDTAADARLAADRDVYARIHVAAQVIVPLIERGSLTGMFYVQHDRTHEWSADEVAFIRTCADRMHAAIAKLRAEEEQDMLNRELAHRFKNMMAMVQAIASQTLRHVTERHAVQALEQRLSALTQAHDLLLRGGITRTSVRAVVDAILVLHGDGHFAVSGDDLMLAPKAALSLAMVLHELGTNAVKYGALSVPGGRVLLDWRIETAEDKQTFVLDWREEGGPPVVEPTRNGFGSRLIRMGIANSRSVDRRYDTDGFKVTFRVPVASLLSQ